MANQQCDFSVLPWYVHFCQSKNKDALKNRNHFRPCIKEAFILAGKGVYFISKMPQGQKWKYHGQFRKSTDSQCGNSPKDLVWLFDLLMVMAYYNATFNQGFERSLIASLHKRSNMQIKTDYARNNEPLSTFSRLNFWCRHLDKLLIFIFNMLLNFQRRASYFVFHKGHLETEPFIFPKNCKLMRTYFRSLVSFCSS